jgi:hypothetical protein
MDSIIGLVCPLFMLGFLVVIIVGMWKVFEKAGQPGWASIIPFYNSYVLTCEIAKKEILWFVLLFIPFVNIVAAILICIEVARKFGRSEAFGIGLAFLGAIFFPILGFGDAQYESGGRRKRRMDYDEDDEEDDRPRKKRRDEDDGVDDRPRKKRRGDDDNW